MALISRLASARRVLTEPMSLVSMVLTLSLRSVSRSSTRRKASMNSGEAAGMVSPEASLSSRGLTRAFPPSMRSRHRRPLGVAEAVTLCAST